MGIGCSRAGHHPDFLLGGYGSPISKEAMKLALMSAGQAGYSDVRLMIHDTFPTDMKKYGTVYIQINSREYMDQGKPRVIQCAGRPHVDVSRELKQSLGFETMGFTVIYIPPASSKKNITPHFVAFHKYENPVYIAWAHEIQGLSSNPIQNVPVVWKLSDDMPVLERYGASSPARAGGVQLVDLRPCLASFTFWFVGCRGTVLHMVEVTKYDAKMIEEKARKTYRERAEERDIEQQRRQRLHERNESDLESVPLASQIYDSEQSSLMPESLREEGLESIYNTSEYDAQEIQLVAEISFDADALDKPLVVSEERISSEKADAERAAMLRELLNGYTGTMFVAVADRGKEVEDDSGAEDGTEEEAEDVRSKAMFLLTQRGIDIGDEGMKKLLDRIHT
jgi:hypothetical protein